MGDYRLQAFHDINADPVATMYVQTGRCIDERSPQLAEEAGLGAFVSITRPPRATSHINYENGVIVVQKEHRGEYD